jgi:hypothetical protein
MKKILLSFIFIIVSISCQNGAKDNKNENEYYPTTDTTQPPERVNDAGDSISHDTSHHSTHDH